ncbi:thiazole biosynthesis enzyme [Vulcanisaeta moutnovskia 768-28]|uniref:Thiamine thiazole synthase n=1 Tax=Vulcanisaeta moutnovskia (strain 768-28) TaxID=985053 RepID=F0QW10_VULM7|nr:sulfide-dependent adenosine diphosphate thiazole synthase [Vulcanisaeta moutnovskia]ADY00934.1 thiazole biosynthesis enzyme [Vulcanisaeta moutnovskia 768-28]
MVGVSISESSITRAIMRSALKILDEYSSVDVAIVGAGPSGMTAAYYLAKAGLKTIVLERRLSFGGGIGGAASHLPSIVIEYPASEILSKDFGIRLQDMGDGLFTIDPAELIVKLAVKAMDAGTKFLLGIHVEDVITRDNPPRVAGLAVYWSTIQMANMHTDPFFIEAKAVVDATGHDAEIANVTARKNPNMGLKVLGERSANAAIAEDLVVKYTGKVVNGLYVTGMAVAAVYGLPRMGPIFGSMIMSGKRVAELIINDLK